MKNETIERKISDLEIFIKLKQDDIDRLIMFSLLSLARYGDGVRPDRVGEGIGMCMREIRYARSQIEELKAEMSQ